MKHLGLFAAGVLFGTAGLKILSSKEAKTVYAHTTAAVLRAKDCVMQTVTTIREGADDIYADAKSINDRRAAEAGELVCGGCDFLPDAFRAAVGAEVQICAVDGFAKLREKGRHRRAAVVGMHRRRAVQPFGVPVSYTHLTLPTILLV